MRLVLAVIQPTKLKPVQEALARVGVERMTVCDAMGYGQPTGQRGGSSQAATLDRKVGLQIAVNDDFLDKTVETIQRVARTGNAGAAGDGKIFVLPIEDVVRLSDAVRGPEGIS